MLVGVDFDNTIANYDLSFRDIAVRQGLVPSEFVGDKRAVKEALISMPDGNSVWTALQAEVYGPKIHLASPFPGVKEFFTRAKRLDVELVIVSHKTQFAAARPNGEDLHLAALNWLKQNGFFDQPISFPQENVYFAPTRQDKCLIIEKLALDVFIDDLIEVFCEPAFPDQVKAVLFNNSQPEEMYEREILSIANWARIGRRILGAHD